jgi:hypothetical protein
MWATKLSYDNTLSLLKRFESGEIGSLSHDMHHANEIRRVMREFNTLTWPQCKTYTSKQVLHEARIVPFEYVQRRLASSAAFRNDRRGSKLAMKAAFETLIDSGLISEVPKQQLATQFAYSGRAFVLLSTN